MNNPNYSGPPYEDPSGVYEMVAASGNQKGTHQGIRSSHLIKAIVHNIKFSLTSTLRGN